MIYSKECVLNAINFVIPQLSSYVIDLENKENVIDILSIVSSVYFLIDEYDDLTPSQKYAFVILKRYAQEFDKSDIVAFGSENVEFKGESLK